MRIETKYKIGDKVYRLFQSTQQTIIACTVCNDTKKVDIKGTLFHCPACVNGKHKWFTRWFMDNEPSTIGKITVELLLANYHNSNYFNDSLIQGDGIVSEEKYMLAATGIRTGTLWNHNDLFLTLNEAEQEASRRNDELIKQEKALPT